MQKAESPAKSGSQDDSNDQVNAGCDRKRAKNKPQRQISVSVFIRALSMNRRNSKAINQAVDKEQERKEKEEDMLILGLTAPTTSHSRKTWIIYPNDRFKEMFWDVIISIILLLTCFMTPINLAFSDEVDKNAAKTIANNILQRQSQEQLFAAQNTEQKSMFDKVAGIKETGSCFNTIKS